MSVPYSTEDYQEMIRCYYLAGANCSEAVRVYAELVQSKGKRVPNPRTIYRAVIKHRETGIFSDVRGGYYSKQRNNLRKRFISYVSKNPTENNCALGRRFGISTNTICKWLKSEGLFYKGERSLKNDDGETDVIDDVRDYVSLRERVVNFARKYPTENNCALARRYGISRLTVKKWLKLEGLSYNGERPIIQRISPNETRTIYPRGAIQKRKRSPKMVPKPKKKKKENVKCCCCLEKDGDRNLWSKEKKSGDDNVYGRLLRECFDISYGILRDGYKICNTCKEQLKQSLQFKRQVLECKERLTKSTYMTKEAVNSEESESGLPDLYDLTDDDMVGRKGTLTDMDDDDDEPLAALEKSKHKDDVAPLKEKKHPVPRIKKLKKKSKLKKIKGKNKTQGSEIVSIEFEVEKKEVAETKVKKPTIDPDIIDLDQEDDVIFVNNDVPGIIELERDNNNQDVTVDEMDPLPEVGIIELERDNNNQDETVDEMDPLPEGITPELEQTKTNENVGEMEPELEIASIIPEIEDNNNQHESVVPHSEPEIASIIPEIEDNNNQHENAVPQSEPEIRAVIPELKQVNANQDENVEDIEPVLEPEPEVEVKAEDAASEDDDEDPIQILFNYDPDVKMEVDQEQSASVKGDDDVIGDADEVGDENAAIQEDEIIAEALPEEVPDPLNGINVIPEIYTEPKEEIDCVSSTIDDSQINENSSVQDCIQPQINAVQTSAVKNIDAIFNCTLREMLARPSNILQDMNRRGHVMLHGFNEPAPPAKPHPQLRTVRRPRRPNHTEELPTPNTSKESRVKRNVSNYLDLLR